MWKCGRTKLILGSTLILTEVFGSSVPNSLVANDNCFNIAGNRSGLMRIWRVHRKSFSAPSGLPMVLHPAMGNLIHGYLVSMHLICQHLSKNCLFTYLSTISLRIWEMKTTLWSWCRIFISKFSSNILDQQNLNSCSFISGHVNLVSKRPQRSEIYS
jgi:hypothetical protein